MTAIGATERAFQASGARNEFERLGEALKQGVDIDIEDVEIRDGLFVYKGHHVVIYIKDHTRRPDVMKAASDGNKVHLMDCKTISQMKAKDRYQRYVATIRTDDLYDVAVLDRNDAEVDAERPLHPCHWCLTSLSYEDYALAAKARQERIKADFQLLSFFDTYASRFSQKPRHSPASMGKVHYTDDFAAISRAKRQQACWRCEVCRVDLSSEHGLLDTHHVNGVKSDNAPANLRALCKLCHAEQPAHQHMRVSREARRTINQLRHWQRRGQTSPPGGRTAKR